MKSDFRIKPVICLCADVLIMISRNDQKWSYFPVVRYKWCLSESHVMLCVYLSAQLAVDWNWLIWNPRRVWRQTNQRRGYTLNECTVFAKRETKRNPNINYEFVLHNRRADLLRYLLKVFALPYVQLIKGSNRE